MEEARQDGWENGEHWGKQETALAMIKDGVPIENASKYSGITIDELRRHIKTPGAPQLCETGRSDSCRE
jgi:hypothetical protein